MTNGMPAARSGFFMELTKKPLVLGTGNNSPIGDRAASDEARLDPTERGLLVAIDHGFDEGDAFQPVPGRGHAIGHCSGCTALGSGPDGLGKARVKVRERLDVALWMARRRADPGPRRVHEVLATALYRRWCAEE